MKITRLSSSELPRDVVDRLLGGYFFASPGFAALWRAKGGRAVAWLAEDAGRAVALVPGVEARGGPVSRFMSMPDGCYGGIFCDAEAAGERPRIARALLEALVARGYAWTHLYDFYGSVPAAPRFTVLPRATTVVEIPDAAWQPPDSKLRSQIRKAEKEGIRVERFDWDSHHAAFLRLVRLAERHHGRPLRYPPAFFEALARLAAADDRVHWLWCARDGQAAASHIYFVEHGALQAWQTYFDRAFSFLKPNQYIRFALCRRFAGQGIRRLNLGCTPAGATGLARYKARWGGRPFLYNAYLHKAGLGRIL